MRVLQINSVCGIGSTGRIATDIHYILIEQGHESYIAYGRDLPKNCDNTIKIGNKKDIYAHVALTRFYDKHGFGSKKATKDFIKIVDKLNPDIIHLHNIHGYYINIEILFDYLKRADKPVVWTLHDCWAFTGHCAHFDYINCNKWKSTCNSCPEKVSYPSSVLIDNSEKNFIRKKELFTGLKNLTLISPSEWLLSLVKESFLRDYKVKIINNGIDLKVFKPLKSNFRKEFNLENKYIILGVASGWTERKGLYYFIKLSSHLKQDEVIVLIGLTEKQIKKLPHNIIGITKTDNLLKLVEIYNAADVFVNPTMEDNFPTVNIEALATGTPIVAFNTGGVPEISSENCGFIVEKGNSEALFRAVANVRANSQIDYFNNCIQAASRFSANEMLLNYKALYTELLKSRLVNEN